ncbi:MAG: hypothetical protein LBQ06_06360, partial [Frankiaceae bacterium]|nr:hypothetical protein [Frankiaceae bacterium]
MSGESVELADVIDSVRRQLLEAQQRGAASGTAQQLPMQIKQVTVELSGEVRDAGTAG